jgi:glycosyltransferase involved in cell wall biosynthesis
MKILWLSWKDHVHPQAGGAEVVLRELNQRLSRDGHEVTILTAGYSGAEKITKLDGVTIIRVGRNRYVHSFRALSHYLRKLRGTFDVVIEVVNTAPYFSTLFGGSQSMYLFYHQLARDVWFHETKFPLNRLGFHVLEPMASRLLARRNTKIITVSESTKQDLARFGFEPTNINIISEGTEITPVSTLSAAQKFSHPTLLSLGAIRPMKRTLDQVKAFELAKRVRPALRLVLAGDDSGSYGKTVTEYCKQSRFSSDITCLGRVSIKQKLDLMRRSHLLMATSIKEGWGLTVTEAASQGTPAVVYDVDGLRDSVKHSETGLVTSPTPTALAQASVALLDDEPTYQAVRRQAWDHSKAITFDQSYQDFKEVVFA